MLAVQKRDDAVIASVAMVGRPVEELLDKEWLLTNNRGSYASSTILCCNVRRYHGLLVGSPHPLSNRIMGLANCVEMVIVNRKLPSESATGNSRKVFNLSTFEFSGKLTPEGFRHLKEFRRDTGVHFYYQLGRITITKSVYLLQDADTVALVYDFAGIEGARKTGRDEESIDFVLRPLIGLRDFHALQKSYASLCADQIDGGLSVRHEVNGSCELFVSCPSMNFRKDGQWWFNFVYRNDKERGQDFTEDLWSPGFYKCRVSSDSRIVFWATLTSGSRRDPFREKVKTQSVPEKPQYDIEAVCRQLSSYQEQIKHKARAVKPEVQHTVLYGHPTQRRAFGSTLSEFFPNGIRKHGTRYDVLCLAADQFIARQRINGQSSYDKRQGPKQDKYRTTILAGFPWFADWGRDAFISLPGLLLLTGRFDEAKSVLIAFAQSADEGMIPNRFDDYSDTAYFNSIDASLWFINAAFQYLNATGDSKNFTQYLLPTIRWIIERYRKGTKFGIHADSDGLITGGNDQTQLTWMDAKYENVAFTARCGKAVEVNALWYNALCYLTEFYNGRDVNAAKHYKSISDKVKASFNKAFWNEKLGYLNDHILPDGSIDETLRPNQIFAVSLTFSPLSLHQARSVVQTVRQHLLTPYGLRTLNSQDSRYKPQYTGPQQQRDEAYHQGTVWPYLIGPFVQAFLRVNDYSRKSRKRAAEFIRPLLRHLTEDGCLGQVSEIFDGDAPQRPKGCSAQAWSVAELIRAYNLINS